MRNLDDISDDEFRARTKKLNSLLQQPYSKASRNLLGEIFRNPDMNEWKNTGKETIFTLTDEFKLKVDKINIRMDLFRMAKFPELVFEIENDEKLAEVETLKSDSSYQDLLKGILYYTEEVYENDDAISEIDNIVDQILNFINNNYPNLFPK